MDEKEIAPTATGSYYNSGGVNDRLAKSLAADTESLSPITEGSANVRHSDSHIIVFSTCRFNRLLCEGLWGNGRRLLRSKGSQISESSRGIRRHQTSG